MGSRSVRGALWAARIAALSLFVYGIGCASIRPYPICYFAEKPSPSEESQLFEGWTRTIRAYLGAEADVTISGDKRWLLARGFDFDHDALGRIWPRFGCVGSYQSSITYPYYSHCLDLLQQMMASRDYLLRGKESDFLNGFYGYCNASLAAELRERKKKRALEGGK
jgi:hypothetical protein